MADLLPFKPGKPASSTSYVDAIDADTTGLTADGVTICMIEPYNPGSSYTYQAALHYLDANAGSDSHARCSAGMIASSDWPGGDARDSWQYWAATAGSYSDEDAYEWCRDNDASVWNIGFETDAGFSKLLDFYVTNPPYPVIVRPTGQDAGSTCSSSCGNTPTATSGVLNNGLVVGGSCDGSTGSRGNDTMFCPTKSGLPSGSTDLQYPHVVAPAFDLHADWIECGNGTSWASALAAGGAAQLIGAYAGLDDWPEGTRALLIATPETTVDGHTLHVLGGNPERDGVGIVNIAKASDLAGFRNYGNVTAAKGWAVGTLYKAVTDLNGGNHNTVYTARTGVSGTRLRIALVWDATNSCTDLSDRNLSTTLRHPPQEIYPRFATAGTTAGGLIHTASGSGGKTGAPWTKRFGFAA